MRRSSKAEEEEEELNAAVNSPAFYSTYHGHDVQLLAVVHQHLRRRRQPLIFFAGDSSLDNKYWFGESSEALNGYEHVLSPPVMKQDVCYWVNRECVERKVQMACINTAVEATSLNDRMTCCLTAQDVFIRDHIQPEDTLVVSVGGNDIALTPTLCTIVNLLSLVWCVPQFCIERFTCACPPNLHLDLGCLGCGVPGCLAGTLCGFPPGLGYFVDLFHNRVKNYVSRLVGGDAKPRRVIICMIYYPDERGSGWADASLGCMCYNSNPKKLQAAIRTIFELATSRIRLPGTEIVPLALFEAMDGQDTDDYVSRVEPSPQGGAKLGRFIMDAVMRDPPVIGVHSDVAAPEKKQE